MYELSHRLEARRWRPRWTSRQHGDRYWCSSLTFTLSFPQCTVSGLRTILQFLSPASPTHPFANKDYHKFGEELYHSDRAINGSSPLHQHATWSHFTTWCNLYSVSRFSRAKDVCLLIKYIWHAPAPAMITLDIFLSQMLCLRCFHGFLLHYQISKQLAFPLYPHPLSASCSVLIIRNYSAYLFFLALPKIQC